MKTNQNGFAALAAILIVLALAGTGAYLYVAQSAKQKTETDSVANWQTYRNAEWGIEIQYPSNWNLEGNEMRDPASSAYVGISQLENPKNLSFDEWWKDGTNVAGRATALASSKDTTINGIKAKIAYMPEENGWHVHIADSQNRIYSLLAEGKAADKQIFEKMLSTLKFIESATKTEILASDQKDLRGQAEKVQLADGTMCVFINGATVSINGERLNYQCGDYKLLPVAIIGDLKEGNVWQANVVNLEWDAAKKEWKVLSAKIVDLVKVWQVPSKNVDWQTYRNEEFGFEFGGSGFERSAVISQNKCGIASDDKCKVLAEFKPVASKNAIAKIIVSVFSGNIADFTFLDQAGGSTYKFDNSKKQWFFDGANRAADKNAPKKMSGNSESYIFESGDGACLTNAIILPNPNKTSAVLIQELLCNAGDNIIKDITPETVLAAFKFTNTTGSQTSISNWKNYSNNSYQIKYPDNYQVSGEKVNSAEVNFNVKGVGSETVNFIARGENTFAFQGAWAVVPISSASYQKIISSENVKINGVEFEKKYWAIRGAGDNEWLAAIVYFGCNSQKDCFSLMRGVTVKGVAAPIKEGRNMYGNELTDQSQIQAILEGIKNSQEKDTTIFNQMVFTFKFIEPQSGVAKTEILARAAKDLEGQAEKVQLADGTTCGFMGGATGVNAKNERLNYQCGDSKNLLMVIYGDLTEGDVWKANVSNIERDEIKKTWNVISTKTVNIAKVWR